MEKEEVKKYMVCDLCKREANPLFKYDLGDLQEPSEAEKKRGFTLVCEDCIKKNDAS